MEYACQIKSLSHMVRPFAISRVCCFPCGFLTSFYCDVTIAQLSDGPFDCDVIMKKSANRYVKMPHGEPHILDLAKGQL